MITTRAICLLLLFNCSFAFSQKIIPMTIILDWVVNPNHAPIIVAYQQGFFSDEGIVLDIHEPMNLSIPAYLARNNQFDFAVISEEQFIIELAQAHKVRRVSTLISGPLQCITVLNTSKINHIEQLRGKKIGYATSADLMYLKTMLGNSSTSNTYIHVGWNMTQALISGTVDAIYGSARNLEPEQLKLKGLSHSLFFPEENNVPDHDALIIIAHQKNDNHEKFPAFNRAIHRANRWIKKHPKKAWNSFISYRKNLLDTELNRQAWVTTLQYFAQSPEKINQESYQNYANYLYDQGIIKESIHLKSKF